jgi:hypothetical protein
VTSKILDGDGPEDYLSWVQHPGTIKFLEGLLQDRMNIMECWARKQFVGDNADQSNFLNAKALAKVETIDEIVDNISNSAEEARRAIKEKN